MDRRVLAVAIFATILAVAWTAIPTPEDVVPVAGWIDEGILWAFAVRLWYAVLRGETFEQVFLEGS